MGEESGGMMGMFKGENGILNIMLVVAIVGSVASKYAPGILAPISGIMGEPLDSILYAYTLMFFMYTIVGEEKDSGDLLKKLMPILMVVIVAGKFFDTGVDTTKYLMLIIAAPLLGKAARNLVQGGLFKLAAKRSEKDSLQKDILETLAGGEKKDDAAKGHGGFFVWDRSASTLVNTIRDRLHVLRVRIKAFNTAKAEFEGQVKNLARLFRVHVILGGNLSHPRTITKAEFDKVKFTAGAIKKKDMAFDGILKELEGNIKKVRDVSGISPLHTILLIDPASLVPSIGADLLVIKDNVLDPHTGKLIVLNNESEELDSALDALTSAYDTGGMLTLKSDDIKDEISSTKKLLKATKETSKKVKEAIAKVD